MIHSTICAHVHQLLTCTYIHKYIELYMYYEVMLNT